ncbi:hypothetical protein [Hyalangium rubrum]|uniref:Lipoprotein n=1 Tax=Hyalangium rubrum TaxID=3103134 RepID=A0ABU5HA99_9BACT|nr:hypothetical protein [Hyalangium sp. s54d21]MDY7229784.1 hypothetical protein [Hyalangium sp. s54d21]
MKRAGLSFVGAVLLLALAGPACRSTAYQTRGDIPSELSASAVMVYPFLFRWPEPAFRSFELSQRLIDVALAEAGESALFFGPSEFKVYRPEDDNAWAASNAVTRLVPYGVRPEQALVLRAWAERRTQSGQGELLDAQGRTVGQSTVEETTYLGHVEVLHPSTRQRVLEVSGEAQADPFAERTDDGADPAPELTRLMEGLTREALHKLEDHLHAPREPSPALATVAFVPWGAFEYTDEARPSHVGALALMDPLDAELLRQQRLRFANPTLEPAVLDRMIRFPAGLYVLSVPPEGALTPGDVILQVEGEPALPQVLARVRLAPAPVQAQVQRPGTTRGSSRILLP